MGKEAQLLEAAAAGNNIKVEVSISSVVPALRAFSSGSYVAVINVLSKNIHSVALAGY